MRGTLRLLDAVAGAALERAGDVVRDRLDDLAYMWIMSRRTYPRAQAAELLEALGERIGAKIEIPCPPGS